MKLLSLDAQRNPDLHQYFGGMKNILYLAGYVRLDTPHVVPHPALRQFWLQATNNENLSLPITLPQGIDLPGRVKDRQGLKVHCNIRGWREDPNDSRTQPELRVFARSFNRVNVLEMPPLTAFQKDVPPEAPEDKAFKPFGSGFHVNGASNYVELAGLVSRKHYRPASANKGAALVMLIRQTADPRHDIPVIYYGRHAEKISEIPMGAPIHVTGRYRLTNVTPTEHINPETKLARVTGTPMIQIDVPTQPTERDILFIDEIRQGRVIWKPKTPDWIFEVAPKRAGENRPRAEKPMEIESLAGVAGTGALPSGAGNLALSSEERKQLGL